MASAVAAASSVPGTVGEYPSRSVLLLGVLVPLLQLLRALGVYSALSASVAKWA